LLVGVFEAHDRTRFETIAISLRPSDESAMRRRVVAAFDRFIDATRMRDVEVSALMRELEVDIAVDLTGYTGDNRTDIFAQRPAPVQVNYLGFPGGMGAEYIDYILADAFVIPDAARPHYAEQVVHLPHCFQANDDQREIAEFTPSRAEAGLPETGFVFCAFNNVYKLNPPMFDIWMRLLRAVPDSVLWLAADAPNVRKNLAAEAMRRGVEPERLVFSPRIAYPEHLARMRLADLFLDTLPFNAGTTASDALWAGLPVLTCAGEAFAARMAGSLLNAVGLPELITHDLAEYEALALELATSPARLAEIKTRLAANRLSAPLFDTKLFCRNLESAYQQMWEKSQATEHRPD
jgi:predicted O-linked N-acetylglucosamine transferase (SPINDLY family)